jgi:hypothetical protein
MDEVVAGDLEEPGYQASYSRLLASESKKPDPTAAAVPDPRTFFAQELSKTSQANPGRVPALLGAVPPPHGDAFRNYLAEQRVVIV